MPHGLSDTPDTPPPLEPDPDITPPAFKGQWPQDVPPAPQPAEHSPGGLPFMRLGKTGPTEKRKRHEMSESETYDNAKLIAAFIFGMICFAVMVTLFGDSALRVMALAVVIFVAIVAWLGISAFG